MAAASLQASKHPKSDTRKRKRGFHHQGAENSPKDKQIALEPPRKRPGAAEGIIDDSIGHMDPGFLADHIAKKIKRYSPDMSTVELEDKYLSQRIFYNTAAFDLPRELNNLPSFLELLLGHRQSLSTTSENTGSPHTLVIAASGLRAADVARFALPASF
jgi:protein CMS1